MKSLSLIFILFICCFHAFAQQYVPMPTGKAQWSYRSWQPVKFGKIQYSYSQMMQTGDDTIVNNLVYKKIMMRYWDTTVADNIGYQPPLGSVVANGTDFFYTAIREDNKKVYITNGKDPETLAFDFTAGVGDTVPHLNFFNYPGQVLVITGIDSVQIGNRFHKRYAAERHDLGGTVNIIEGVGTDKGLMSYLSVPFSYWTFDFQCMVSDSIYYSPASACNYIWPQGTPTNVENVKEETEIAIYPNPFGDHLTIKSANAGSATIYNMTGTAVLKAEVDKNTTISTGHLPAGIYLLKLVDKNGHLVQTEKLIKH